MNKKLIAKEILIFFGSIILILAICVVWYFITINENSKNEIGITQIGFREQIFNNLNKINKKDKFENIIEINDKSIFLRTISDTTINRKLYNKSKELERYIWNGKLYSKAELTEKYGDKVDSKIQKYGFRISNYLTDLDYSEFNHRIQSDIISNETIIKQDNNDKLKSRDYYFDFGLITGIILLLIYPLRWVYKVLKWSLTEIKN